MEVLRRSDGHVRATFLDTRRKPADPMDREGRPQAEFLRKCRRVFWEELSSKQVAPI
jgi:hypothetical protein